MTVRTGATETDAVGEEVASWAAMVAEEPAFAVGTFVDGRPGGLTGDLGLGAEGELVAAPAPGTIPAGAGAISGARG